MLQVVSHRNHEPSADLPKTSDKPTPINPDSLRRQLDLEQESILSGIQAYRDRVKQTPALYTSPGNTMMLEAMEPLTKAIKAFMVPCRGAARQTQVRRFLEWLKVSPEELAYITLQQCLQTLASEERLQTAAINLATAVIDHYEYTRFKVAHPRYLTNLEESLKSTPQHKRRKIVMLKKRERGISDEHHEKAEKLLLGCRLIDLCVTSTGLVGRYLVGDDGYYLRGTEEAHRWLEAAHEHKEVMSPLCLPMVAPPKPWEGVSGGGYYSNAITDRYPLLKTHNRKSLEILSKHHMPQVYEALNSVQETPWRINRKVYDLMLTLWNEQHTVAGESKAERTSTGYKLRTAQKFLQESAIFFPHVLDWRGRLYPLNKHMHPQANDTGKGLLEFAEGKAIGSEGVQWLKIHLANTYGVDKVSYSERVTWTEAHREKILHAALSPLDSLDFWTAADSPFCFLAACFEFADLSNLSEQMRPFYRSHIPIALDGTCSGLQHFSAMLKDPVGGAAVNLLPSDRPQDIYSVVAGKVSARVSEDALGGIEEARLWEGKIDRGITKRPVMTYPYGATKRGYVTQLMEELEERGTAFLGADRPLKACVYLAGVLWETIGETVVAAKTAMDWLQEVARITAKAGLPLEWITPTGFKVRQEYKKKEAKRIDTFWGGTNLRLTLTQDGGDIDRRQQVSGIAPNFVHSLDASHLMSTVLACKAQGISSFAVIHDSFGVHACHVGTLARTLRETFVEQYSANVLEVFRRAVLEQLPEDKKCKIPPVPDMGKLNLKEVTLSPYFFH